MPVKRADKTAMPVREAQARAHDFKEVNTGYTASQAAFESERCLRCQDPVCVDGCPVSVPIPEFIHAVATGDMAGAARIAAMILGSPPQIGQCSRPIWTTRSSSLAQLSRTGHDHRQSRPAGARTIWAQRLLGPVQVVVAFPSRP